MELLTWAEVERIKCDSRPMTRQSLADVFATLEAAFADIRELLHSHDILNVSDNVVDEIRTRWSPAGWPGEAQKTLYEMPGSAGSVRPFVKED